MIDLHLKYQVFQCPKCGNVQQSMSKKTFKCFRCAKSTKIVSDKKAGLNLKLLYSTNNPMEVNKIVGELKKMQFETKGKAF